MKKHAILMIICLLTITNSYGQWENVDGIYGGTITDIVSKDSMLFITTGNGLYRSSDNGNSWTRINTENSLNWYQGLLYCDSTLYTCGQRIFKSIDNGETWVDISGNIMSTATRDIEKRDSLVFIVSTGGLYYSNSDSNWININGNHNFTFLTDVEIENNRIYVSYSDSIWYSENMGENWVSITSPIFENDLINSMYVKDSIIYLATQNGVYCSYNSGIDWIDATFGLTDYETKTRDIIIDGGTIYLATMDGLFKKELHETIWQPLTMNLVNRVISTVYTTPSDIIVGIEKEGIRKSEKNSFVWEEKNLGISGVDIISILNINDSIYVGTEGAGVYFSHDAGQSWTKRNNNLLDFHVKDLQFINNTIYAGCVKGLYVSYDFGQTWISEGFQDTSINAILEVDSLILVGTDYGVNKKNINGNVWTDFSDGLDEPVYDLERNSQYVLAATYYDNIYRLEIGLDHWINTNNYLSNSLYSMARYQEKILIGTWDGIFITEDNGLTWDNCYITPNRPCKSITVHENKILACNNEIFYSIDSGVTWNYFVEGFNGYINFDKISHSNSYYFIATSLGQLYRRPITDLGFNNVMTNNFLEFYPNPTIDKIYFETDIQEDFVVEIYNLKGQKIITSFDKIIDFSKQAAGQYIVILKTKKSVFFNKIIKE